MGKDRLKDSFEYLKQRAMAGELPGITNGEVQAFKAKVEKLDLTNGGNALSLGWKDTNRPDKDTRAAIRAYLLASIYNGDINVRDARTEAVNVEAEGRESLYRKIATRVRQYLCSDDPINTQAVFYRLKTKGGGTQMATAVCEVTTSRVVSEMSDMHMIGTRVAVVLIDMQDQNVGEDRVYGGKSILEHQKAVLAAAKDLNLIVYDIVIDTKSAYAFGDPYQLVNIPLEQKRAIIARQRRDSYEDKAPVRTMSILRDYFKPGTRVRHIPKPSHPAFLGTLFSEHLKSDGTEIAVVLGFDANQCIKATVFGVPSEIREEAELEPTAEEVQAVLNLNSKLTLPEAQKRATPTKMVTTPYVPGLLDLGIWVLTSRSIMASRSRVFESEWGKLSGLP
jgi:nicotinamidase-related amidase